MSPEDRATLDALDAYVLGFERSGKTARDFWQGFGALEGDLSTRAFADDSAAELRERYCEVLANADDAGYAVPDEMLGEPFPE